MAQMDILNESAISQYEYAPNEEFRNEVLAFKNKVPGGGGGVVKPVNRLILALRKGAYLGYQADVKKKKKPPAATYKAPTAEQIAANAARNGKKIRHYDAFGRGVSNNLPIMSEVFQIVRNAYAQTPGLAKGGLGKSNLIFYSTTINEKTGALQPVSKSIFGGQAKQLYQDHPIQFAAVKVLQNWNRFMRSLSNYYRWSTFPEKMADRRAFKALVKQQGGSYQKVLNLVQSRKKKYPQILNLSPEDAYYFIEEKHQESVQRMNQRMEDYKNQREQNWNDLGEGIFELYGRDQVQAQGEQQQQQLQIPTPPQFQSSQQFPQASQQQQRQFIQQQNLMQEEDETEEARQARPFTSKKGTFQSETQSISEFPRGKGGVSTRSQTMKFK